MTLATSMLFGHRVVQEVQDAHSHMDEEVSTGSFCPVCSRRMIWLTGMSNPKEYGQLAVQLPHW
jgi:hypothetical protein